MSATDVTAGAGAGPARHPRLRVPASFLSICFGLAALATAWHTAEPVVGIPQQAADAFYLLAAAVWLALVLAYLAQGVAQIRADLSDSVVSPYVPLAVITPMILAAGLAPTALTAARVLVVIFMILTVAIGGWLTGQWVAGRIDVDSTHPGYFVPTVAGGFTGAFAAAAVHLHAVAEASFGIGIVCWLLLNSVLLGRLFFRPALPVALLPMLAIDVAPPALAGLAYFEITGGRIDFLARALGGFAVLMVIVQLRFIPVYLQLSFTPAFWAFTFPYAAVATDILLWLRYGDPPGARAYAIAILVLITILLTGITARTLIAISRHQFFPAPAGVTKAPGSG
jgi:tellurite resistance protein